MAETSSGRACKATREAVFTAAERLDGKGIAPTVEKVGEITGGSFSTITKHLRAWREERAAKAELTTALPEMPEEMTTLWARLWRLAEAEHQERRDGWHHIRRGLENEIAERDKEIARLEALDAEKAATIARLTERALDAEARSVSIEGLGYGDWPTAAVEGQGLPWSLFGEVGMGMPAHLPPASPPGALSDSEVSDTAGDPPQTAGGSDRS